MAPENLSRIHDPTRGSQALSSTLSDFLLCLPPRGWFRSTALVPNVGHHRRRLAAIEADLASLVALGLATQTGQRHRLTDLGRTRQAELIEHAGGDTP